MTRAASGPELRWRICVAPAEDDLANFRDVMELISTRVMHLLICSRLSLSLSPVPARVYSEEDSLPPLARGTVVGSFVRARFAKTEDAGLRYLSTCENVSCVFILCINTLTRVTSQSHTHTERLCL